MNIRHLPSKWRKGYQGLQGSREVFMCADQLETALPVWTKITEDEATWPPKGTRVLTHRIYRDGSGGTGIEKRLREGLYQNVLYSSRYSKTHWRLLCDLDYPPEQS